MAAARTKTPDKTFPDKTFDVAIAGGGPVGLTLALAQARRGLRSCVVDAGGNAVDGRAFFVAFGCWRIWRALGLEAALAPHARAVTSVEAEGPAGGVSFLAEDCDGEPALGYMIEQGPLVKALEAAASGSDLVTLRSGRISGARFGDPCASLLLEDGEVGAALIAACDGARSAVRTAANIRFEGWDYAAKAISTTVTLPAAPEAAADGGAARQIFLPSGPMAALPLTPLPGDAAHERVNLVWTERAAVADALIALDDEGFEAELAKRAGDFLPGAKLAGRRHAFPVGLRVAERFHGPRLALAGDAAHQIHPLAGQGLNLGSKDVAALTDVIADAARVGLDIGAETALAPYTRWRRADVVASAAAMEGFARAFCAPAPIRIAAALAMRAAGRSGAGAQAVRPRGRRRHRRSAEPDAGKLVSRQSQLLHLADIGGHARVFLFGQLAQVGPGVEPGVVAIVEMDAHGIASDRIGAFHRDMRLVRGRGRARAAMAFGFGAGAFHAQEFVGNFARPAIVEADGEARILAAEAKFSGPGRVFWARRRTGRRAAAANLKTVWCPAAHFADAKVAGLVGQHHRYAITDWKGEPGAARDQLVGFAIVGERSAADRTDQNFEESWIDSRIVFCRRILLLGFSHCTYPPPCPGRSITRRAMSALHRS